MTTALYRKSSNEVLAISLTDDPFLDNINEYFAAIDNATYPDGTDCIDSSGHHRVLGYAKILDGTVIQNATQVEIDTFLPAGVDDHNKQEADRAINYFQQDPKFRRIMIAFADIMVSQINKLRVWDRELKSAVAASTSLADFQSRVSGLDTLQDKTLAQLKTAIQDRVSKDD